MDNDSFINLTICTWNYRLVMLKKDIKVIVFDYDGTLVPKNRQYSDLDDKLVELLNKLKKENIELVIATGRHPTYIEKRVKKIKFNIIIGYSGNIVYHNKKIDSYIFEKKDIKELINYFKERNELDIRLFTINNYVVCQNEYEKNIQQERINKNRNLIDLNGVCDLIISDYINKDINLNICRICIKLSSLNKREAIQNEFCKQFYNYRLVKTGDKQVEILNINYSKSSRICELIKKMNYTKDNIITIGDDENDYEMLNDFSNSYFVGDSNLTYIKDVSSYHELSCEKAIIKILKELKND